MWKIHQDISIFSVLWNHKFPQIFNNRDGPLQKMIVYTAYENMTNCFSSHSCVSRAPLGWCKLSSKYSLVSCSAFKRTIFFFHRGQVFLFQSIKIRSHPKALFSRWETNLSGSLLYVPHFTSSQSGSCYNSLMLI